MNTDSKGAAVAALPTALGGPAPFHRTVDVLELVCETVGVVPDDGATLMALRRCSKAWADAVSSAVRRGDWPGDAAERVAGVMAPDPQRGGGAPVRRDPAARGCPALAARGASDCASLDQR